MASNVADSSAGIKLSQTHSFVKSTTVGTLISGVQQPELTSDFCNLGSLICLPIDASGHKHGQKPYQLAAASANIVDFDISPFESAHLAVADEQKVSIISGHTMSADGSRLLCLH